MKAPRRRHRVATRPKLRQRKLKQSGAALAVVALALMAVGSLRQLRRELPSLREPQAAADLKLEGVPAPLEDQVRRAASELAGGPSEAAEALAKDFPVFSEIKVSRSWRGAPRLTFALRRAAARLSDGRSFLSDDGVAFAAPAELFPEPLPQVDVKGAPAAELKALSAALGVIRTERGLPSPFKGMRYASREDGWMAELEDGTKVQWGKLDWTAERIERLKQVLEAARVDLPRPGPLTADLRYFEDGRILVR
jgi:hypothetical protein